MPSVKTAFSQVMEEVHPQQFRRCVERYDGDRRFRSLSCSDQFLAMAFAQLTYRDGLRDIENELFCERRRTGDVVAGMAESRMPPES